MMKNIIKCMFAAIMLCSISVFTSCSSDDDEQVPGGVEKRDRARYTVIIYGNAGGHMDDLIEGTWDKLKPMLDDSTNVRVCVVYKYGMASNSFKGKYGKPNDLVMFELNSKTDLTKLHETSAVSASEFRLYDPKSLASYIKYVKEYAPADNYIFAIWGHGGGYDVTSDRPDNMVTTRAMLYDEALEGEAMSMYQLSDALATCGNTHFKLIMLHNCLMGNIETLTEIQPYADYFWASSHSLASIGDPIITMVDKLKNSTDYNFEDRAKEMFTDLRRIYTNREGIPADIAKEMSDVNMDFKIIRSDDLTILNNNLNFFITRLLELYPTLSPEVMERAMTASAYSYEVFYPYLIDLRHYIQTVAAAINDPELSAHAKNAIDCMDKSVVDRWDEAKESSKLRKFYLSVSLPYHDFLHYTTNGNYTVAESYYPSAFNRRTGWALWMNTNTYFPTKWMFNTEKVSADADMTKDIFFKLLDQLNKNEQEEYPEGYQEDYPEEYQEGYQEGYQEEITGY